MTPSKVGPAKSGVSKGRKTSPTTSGRGIGGLNNLLEIYGVALMALGVLTLLFVFTTRAGVVGDYTVAFLKYAVGSGRFLVPVLLLAAGATLLSGRTDIDLERAGLGVALFFAALLAFVHMAALELTGAPLARSFAPSVLVTYGGTVGAALAYVFGLLLHQAAYVVFLALMMIGILLATGISLAELRHNASEWLESRREGRDEAPTAAKGSTSRAAPTIEYPEFAKSGPPIVEDVRDEPPRSQLVEPKTTTPKQLAIEVAEGAPYRLPPTTLLRRTTPTKGHGRKSVEESIAILEKTLRDFDVGASVTRVVRGPTVTRFEIELDAGVKVGRISSLADDIALALASTGVRIQAPIPGRAAVGVEVPNQFRELVTLGDVMTTDEAGKEKSVLTVVLGKDIAGQPILTDLGGLPHLLIAGATGSGKSVCINTIIMSLLMRAKPDQVKLILVDPKRIELNLFSELPHLITPVVTSPKLAATALAWAVGEMERRFESLAANGSRNIDMYNETIKREDSEADLMPYIVIVIDELADLMMVSAAEVEDAVCRIAQLARAVGIHLVLATQRPSVDIITGLIKANITARVAFAVSSATDSRVILDGPGAEKLVGKGDCLFTTPALPKPHRVQAAMVTESEIEMITSFIKKQAQPDYRSDILEEGRSKFSLDYDDEMLDSAMDLVVTTQTASVSMLQRRLRLGYARAARLMDMLEQKGVVGPPDGSRPRAVLMTEEELDSYQSQE